MSMYEKPTIAIIIPNHNYGKWILDSIKSVVDDEYPKKKIFIIDDGSTDDSNKKVLSLLDNKEKFESNSIPGIYGKYKNVDLYLIAYNECKGPSFARNIGIKAAWEKTDTFSFLDSDDLHINGKLAITSNALINGWGAIGAVYSDYINFDSETNLKHPQFKDGFCSEKILFDCIMPSNSLVPKYVFEKIGLFNESMRVAEDWDFWIRMSKFYIGYHIPKFLSLVRTGNYNSTNTVPKEVWLQNWQKIRETVNNAQ